MAWIKTEEVLNGMYLGKLENVTPAFFWVYLNLCKSTIISNQDLWKRARQQTIEADTFQSRWKWIGHTLWKSSSNITRQALTLNPQGKRKTGRPRNSWRRDLEADTRRNGYTWGELQWLSQDRDDWRVLIGGLCPRRGHRQWLIDWLQREQRILIAGRLTGHSHLFSVRRPQTS